MILIFEILKIFELSMLFAGTPSIKAAHPQLLEAHLTEKLPADHSKPGFVTVHWSETAVGEKCLGIDGVCKNHKSIDDENIDGENISDIFMGHGNMNDGSTGDVFMDYGNAGNTTELAGEPSTSAIPYAFLQQSAFYVPRQPGDDNQFNNYQLNGYQLNGYQLNGYQLNGYQLNDMNLSYAQPAISLSKPQPEHFASSNSWAWSYILDDCPVLPNAVPSSDQPGPSNQPISTQHQPISTQHQPISTQHQPISTQPNPNQLDELLVLGAQMSQNAIPLKMNPPKSIPGPYTSTNRFSNDIGSTNRGSNATSSTNRCSNATSSTNRGSNATGGPNRCLNATSGPNAASDAVRRLTGNKSDDFDDYNEETMTRLCYTWKKRALHGHLMCEKCLLEQLQEKKIYEIKCSGCNKLISPKCMIEYIKKVVFGDATIPKLTSDDLLRHYKVLSVVLSTTTYRTALITRTEDHSETMKGVGRLIIPDDTSHQLANLLIRRFIDDFSMNMLLFSLNIHEPEKIAYFKYYCKALPIFQYDELNIVINSLNNIISCIVNKQDVETSEPMSAKAMLRPQHVMQDLYCKSLGIPDSTTFREDLANFHKVLGTSRPVKKMKIQFLNAKILSLLYKPIMPRSVMAQYLLPYSYKTLRDKIAKKDDLNDKACSKDNGHNERSYTDDSSSDDLNDEESESEIGNIKYYIDEYNEPFNTIEEREEIILEASVILGYRPAHRAFKEMMASFLGHKTNPIRDSEAGRNDLSADRNDLSADDCPAASTSTKTSSSGPPTKTDDSGPINDPIDRSIKFIARNLRYCRNEDGYNAKLLDRFMRALKNYAVENPARCLDLGFYDYLRIGELSKRAPKLMAPMVDLCGIARYQIRTLNLERILEKIKSLESSGKLFPLNGIYALFKDEGFNNVTRTFIMILSYTLRDLDMRALAFIDLVEENMLLSLRNDDLTVFVKDRNTFCTILCSFAFYLVRKLREVRMGHEPPEFLFSDQFEKASTVLNEAMKSFNTVFSTELTMGFESKKEVLVAYAFACCYNIFIDSSRAGIDKNKYKLTIEPLAHRNIAGESNYVLMIRALFERCLETRLPKYKRDLIIVLTGVFNFVVSTDTIAYNLSIIQSMLVETMKVHRDLLMIFSDYLRSNSFYLNTLMQATVEYCLYNYDAVQPVQPQMESYSEFRTISLFRSYVINFNPVLFTTVEEFSTCLKIFLRFLIDLEYSVPKNRRLFDQEIFPFINEHIIKKAASLMKRNEGVPDVIRQNSSLLQLYTLQKLLE